MDRHLGVPCVPYKGGSVIHLIIFCIVWMIGDFLFYFLALLQGCGHQPFPYVEKICDFMMVLTAFLCAVED